MLTMHTGLITGVIHLVRSTAGCAGACVSFSPGCRDALRFVMWERGVPNGEFEIVHVASAKQHADYLINTLHRETFCLNIPRWESSSRVSAMTLFGLGFDFMFSYYKKCCCSTKCLVVHNMGPLFSGDGMSVCRRRY